MQEVEISDDDDDDDDDNDDENSIWINCKLIYVNFLHYIFAY